MVRVGHEARQGRARKGGKIDMRNIEAYKRQVDQLFRELRGPSGTVCDWPVIGGHFLKGEKTTRMRQKACKALAARDWFAINGPPDAPPLPLSYDEREALKHGGLDHIVAWYARSLAALEFDVEKHPSFEDYARGVVARGQLIEPDETLERRFPPRTLNGLGPGLYWNTPEYWQRIEARRVAARAH
jgi:hypothetical protein